MTSEEMAVKVTEVDQRSKSNTHRIDKLEQSTGAIHSLAESIAVLVNEQKNQTDTMNDIKSDVAKLDGKVEALEAKPAKKWETAVDIVFKILVTAVVGLALAKIGLG